MKTSRLLSFFVSAGLMAVSTFAAYAETIVGHWTFDDPDDLEAAEVGSPLQSFFSVGSNTGTITPADGVEEGDGASVITRGAYFVMENPIGPNGGDGFATRSNRYTLLVDFQIPEETVTWYTILKTGPNVASGDGDYFIRKQGTALELGVANQGYVGPSGSVSRGVWHRLVIVVDQGVGRQTYLNGALMGSHGAGVVDAGRWSLGETAILFGDNDGDDGTITVSNVVLYDGALSAEQVAAIPLAGGSVVPPESFDLTWTGALSGEWSTAELEEPKNWTSDGSPADFTDFDEVAFLDGGRARVEIDAEALSPRRVVVSSDDTDYEFVGNEEIIGTAELIKDGMSTLTIGNPNSFTGNTFVNDGVLVIDHPFALRASAVTTVFNFSELRFGETDFATIGGLAGTGDVVLENAASEALLLDLNVAAGTQVANGELSGAGSLVKNGPGTQVLSFPSTYTGGTVMNAGVLRIEDPEALGEGGLDLNGGQLRFAFLQGSEETFANDIVLGPGPSQPLVIQASGGAAPSPGTTVTLSGRLSGGSPGTAIRLLDSNFGGNHNHSLVLENPENDFEGDIEMWRGSLVVSSDEVLGHPDNGIIHYTENLNGAIRFAAEGVVLNAGREIRMPGAANSRPFHTGGFTATIEGPVSGTGSLVKQGQGTLILNGGTSYTGNTTIAAGTLRLATPTLSDEASLILVSTLPAVGEDDPLPSNATLDLPHGETDTVGALILDGVEQAPGLWGDPGNPAATRTTPLISGSGLIRVPGDEEPEDAYARWIASFPGLTGDLALPGADPDGDGVSNGLEFLLGGNPSVAGSAVLPLAERVEDGVRLVFPLAPEAAEFLRVETSTTLAGEESWSPLDASIEPTIIADGFRPGLDRAEIVLPDNGGALFARLRAEF